MPEIKNDKSEDVLKWYEEVLEKSEVVQSTSVPGSIVYREEAYEIWEQIQDFLNKKLKELGFKNMYFPLFIPLNLMKKESKHFEDFALELATITKVGEEELSEKLVVRPTSEMIIYDSVSKWIESNKEFPILINQFCSVVRWEKRKKNVPLIRDNEFLWQESHSLHENEEEAEIYVKKVLEIYKELIKDYLAIPVFEGIKPEHRKFPGAKTTYALESLMPGGKAIQMATSHNLGQNFSKALNLEIEKEGKKEFVWQASNGCTTRLIGAMIMFHGDNSGLIIPPKVSGIQVIALNAMPDNLIKKLKEKSIRTKQDKRSISLKEKIESAKLKGIPIILIKENGQLKLIRRDNLTEEIINGEIESVIEKELNEMQKRLIKKGKDFSKKNFIETNEKKKVKNALINKEGMILTNWCGNVECARTIKKETHGSLRIIKKETKGKCSYCNNEAKFKAYFAEAY